MVSASDSETSVPSSTTASAIIYDACTSIIKKIAHFWKGGRVVSASGSETSVSSLMLTSAIIYDAYTSMHIYFYSMHI